MMRLAVNEQHQPFKEEGRLRSLVGQANNRGTIQVFRRASPRGWTLRNPGKRMKDGGWGDGGRTAMKEKRKV